MATIDIFYRRGELIYNLMVWNLPRILSLSLSHTHTHTHNTQPFYGSLDFVRDITGEPVPEDTFRHLLDLIFCSKMKITQADAPTIWMDCHPIQTNWCPHLCHPHHFYAGCPSLPIYLGLEQAPNMLACIPG